MLPREVAGSMDGAEVARIVGAAIGHAHDVIRLEGSAPQGEQAYPAYGARRSSLGEQLRAHPPVHGAITDPAPGHRSRSR